MKSALFLVFFVARTLAREKNTRPRARRTNLFIVHPIRLPNGRQHGLPPPSMMPRPPSTRLGPRPQTTRGPRPRPLRRGSARGGRRPCASTIANKHQGDMTRCACRDDDVHEGSHAQHHAETTQAAAEQVRPRPIDPVRGRPIKCSHSQPQLS